MSSRSSCRYFSLHFQLDGELGADAQFAVCHDGALVVFDDFIDVGKAESEPFHVVEVARVYAVELLEDALQVFFLDADAIVLDKRGKQDLILRAALFGQELCKPGNGI